MGPPSMAAAALLAGRRVCALIGAGLSVSSGIPDFRSPGGMYDTLRPELLTASELERRAMRADPTAVVSWEIFSRNQLPYLELRRPFMLGVLDKEEKGKDTYKPTLGHFFFRVCHDKGLLKRLYTQNIDGLDYKTGIPNDKIISVHGSLGRVECEGCKTPYPSEKFCSEVREKIKDIYNIDEHAPKESRPIECLSCGKPLVKPATVLYGRNLPPEFWERKDEDMQDLDVLIVAGTSLAVQPAASLVTLTNKRSARIVVNKEEVERNFPV
ncbi:hypothetical protein GUITHDRAFT_115023 [Guillardia theta CCMP2712]|uniref:Deacetylase sirtuin-type domain-containing protein n=1 Tax=Guillardia theta (strain CCMP2712) TaxID=905079 RepID=L1ISV9_GUITC|nr:hypothetical protein GUITHDRAFT_115023 [Guillardia theta CCMP2712]EKX38920.1 hypothetical protein GUITHDRAFT_115023 [Guillardia theta CCMP2712]|eukprot:XP_005825900.1 hypothetical protein GUITHDRAFT_115023 [Guillardia theta CCMP2712]